MNEQEFTQLVKDMREHQTQLFATRSTTELRLAKEAEKKVDAEIARRERIEQERLQSSLFDL